MAVLDRESTTGHLHRISKTRVEPMGVVVDDKEPGVGIVEEGKTDIRRPEVGPVVVLDQHLNEHPGGERIVHTQATEIGREGAAGQVDVVACHRVSTPVMWRPPAHGSDARRNFASYSRRHSSLRSTERKAGASAINCCYQALISF